MKLRLRRDIFSDKSTIGTLYVDNVRECYILEDKDRRLEDGGDKIAGQTAIPRGEYEVIITYSNRFKRPLPLLIDVPNYSGVRIHPGNTAEDTEGCLLPGIGVGIDAVYNSRAAFDVLFNKLEAAEALGEEVWIEIV